MILYAQPIAKKIQSSLLRSLRKTTKRPTLAIVLVGNNTASERFIIHKVRKSEELSVGVRLVHLPTTISTKKLEAAIRSLNKDKAVHGIIIQLPLPEKFNTDHVISSIDPVKDIDNLWGDSPYTSPTVQAIGELLGVARVKNLKNKKALIVGYGRLVGKPLHAFLVKKGFTNITIADKSTKNIPQLLKEADIVVTGIGKPGYVKDVKKGAIVIDAGTAIARGKLCGDVDLKKIAPRASLVTPVPGGVGILTILFLYKNLLLAASRISKD